MKMMELLRRLSLSSAPATSPKSAHVSPTISASSDMTTSKSSPLLELPNEIVHQILAHLSPTTLLQVSATCRTLRSHANNDLLWARFVRDNVPFPQSTPIPYDSWRELFTCHYPYWFLPKHKIWYSDKAATGNGLVGQLILARYDHRTGSIEAYRLVAEFSVDNRKVEEWEWNNSVIIHSFDPKISLFLDDPVIKLDHDIYQPGGRLQQELPMAYASTPRLHGLRAVMFLTRAISPELQDPSMALWPPTILPAANRVRNDSANMFRDDSHKPQNIDQLSDTSFRFRKWMEFRGMGDRLGVRMGEDVMTFGTLPPECYVPTKEKPYQGIWVGDYAGHGCEFLVVLQKEVETTRWVPPMEQRMLGPVSSLSVDADGANGSAEAEAESQNRELEDPVGCTGRLEAVKLTGDPNVPRGEYSWIAEDIGHKGLIRVADEQMFKGARVVKSWGHIAARGFRDDKYIPSHLIMVSHDCLAQYWEDFGHISFFNRINIDDYLRV